MPSAGRTELVLAALVIVIAAAYLSVSYIMGGPGWDLIAHYLNGRSLSNPAFWQCLLNRQCNLYNQNPQFYFESYRAPAAGFIIAFINLFVNSTADIPVYIAVLFAGYLLSVRFLSRQIRVNGLLLLAMLLSPYILAVSIIPGSEEIASLIFLLIAIGFLARRSPWFGLFLGLATLGKYPTLILIPMLLMLIEPRKILYASVLFAVAVVPWLAFNQIFFTNGPFTSYLLSMAISHNNSGPLSFSLPAYATILGYPLIFAALGIILVYPNRKAIIKLVKRQCGRADILKIYKSDRNYLYSILTVLILLSLTATLYIGPYYDQFTQERYGYLLGISTALFVAVLLDDARKYTKVNLQTVVAALSIAMFLYVIYQNVTTPPMIGAGSQPFKSAASELSALGYGNCKITTNDWMYMLWQNVSAFSQFNSNSTAVRYPIIAFHNQSSLTDINYWAPIDGAKTVYSSPEFSILIPQNYRCYT